jgi:endonuclease YncB( thermonuclease family)
MEKQQGNRAQVIGIILLTIACAGTVCLAVFTPLGSLAIRRFAAPSETPTPSPTSVKEITPSPTNSPTPVPTLPAVQVVTDTPDASQTALAGSATPPAAVTVTPQPILPTASPIPPQQTASPGATMAPVALDAWCVPWNSPAEQTHVRRAVDGVTIEVSLDGKVEQVRYIGVELPDFSDDWRVWAQSTEKNKELVEGKPVTLIEGTAETDGEGRLLRYVIVEGVFANLEMVTSGYAVARSTPPDTGCDSAFLAAEEAAVLGGRGLWAPPATPTRTQRPPTATVSAIGDVVVVHLFAVGTPWQEPDEFVEIYNSGVAEVQLQGWSVSDIQDHVFVFPRFILGPGEYCRVYTNLYRPENCGFSYFNPSPIWDNFGDCAYLKDSTGRLVSEFCYE